MKKVRMGLALALILTMLVNIVALTSTVIDVNRNSQEINNLSIERPNFTQAGLDLDRVEWKMNHFENPGFELWNDPHTPAYLPGYYGDRTQEEWAWYATSPWPVNEGLRSMGLQAKALDPNHEATSFAYTYPSGWNNMLNLTFQLDWYIDELPSSIDNDAFCFIVYPQGMISQFTKRLVYYLGSWDTSLTNTSYRGFFKIDGPAKSWNTFSRNVTADWIEVYSTEPDAIRRVELSLTSKTQSYSRTFADNLIMTNNSVLSLYGDFESGSWTRSHSDPADISQCTDRIEGLWSLNATTISNGNESKAYWTTNPERRASALNPDTLSFRWKLDEWQVLTGTSYGYIYINGRNSSGSEFGVVYFLYFEGSYPWTPDGNYHFINATDFNTLGQWNYFERSVFSDIASFNQTDDFIIIEIEFEFLGHGKGIRSEILLDDFVLSLPALNDMGYEDQGDVGEPISAWNLDDYDGTPEMVVTDLALNGTKAANITVSDGDSVQYEVDFEYRPINIQTETFLYLNWRLEDFTGLDNEIVYIEIYPDSEYPYAYIFANGSEATTADGFDDRFFLLPNINQTGVWFNLHRNLYEDMKTIYGDMPDTKLASISIDVVSKSGGRISFLLDDVYLYNDVAPEIENIQHSPLMPEYSESVTVTATVIDSSQVNVTLHYRVNSGEWYNVTMNLIYGNIYSGTIPAQASVDFVEYFITAEDIAGKMTEVLDGGEYFSYTVEPSTTISTSTSISTSINTSTTTSSTSEPPSDNTLLLIAVVVGAGIVLLVVIIFMRKRKGS